jgi:DNA damage-inducible protein 1
MKLTIIGEENVYEQEVSQSMDVQDVIALIAAEVSCHCFVLGTADDQADLPQDSILLSSDSGEPLSDGSKSLASYGLTTDATLFMTLTSAVCLVVDGNELTSRNQASSSSSSAAVAPLPAGFPSSDAELERMRLQALGNPRLMEDLRSVS